MENVPCDGHLSTLAYLPGGFDICATRQFHKLFFFFFLAPNENHITLGPGPVHASIWRHKLCRAGVIHFVCSLASCCINHLINRLYKWARRDYIAA
jgi:hypothetical protein